MLLKVPCPWTSAQVEDELNIASYPAPSGTSRNSDLNVAMNTFYRSAFIIVWD